MIKKWLRLRRDRRIAALGGRPVDSDVPALEFRPRPIGEAEMRAMVDKYTAALAPRAVDEATGGPLDNLINAMAEHWLADLDVEYAEYRVAAGLRLGRTTAWLDQQQVLLGHDLRHRRQTELVLEAVLHRLAVPDPDDVPAQEEEEER